MMIRCLALCTICTGYVPTRVARSPARLAARPSAGDDEPNLAVKGAWFAAEAFGRVAALSRGAETAVSTAAAPRSLDEAIARVAADYEGADGPYFFTGKMDEALYDSECEFADPFVSFRGRQRFVDNLANLAGGFIEEVSARPLSTTRALEGDSPTYATKLLVKLRLALPWKPVLAWPWSQNPRRKPI